MSHRYNPVGACIYCNSTTGSFQDEHIVAYGLGGKLILPDASCATCARITSQIEQHCLRGIFLPARAHLRLPTRRKLPVTLPIDVAFNGRTIRLEVPIARHPGYLFSFDYDPPYILDGFEPMGVQRGGRMAVRNLNADQEDRLNRFKGKIHFPANFDAGIFARMIAKIAYSYAVGERRFGSFQPLVCSIILSPNPTDLHFVVGGTPGALDGEGMIRFKIEEREVVSTAFRRRKLLIVSFQLFAEFDMPTYQVVVGELP